MVWKSPRCVAERGFRGEDMGKMSDIPICTYFFPNGMVNGFSTGLGVSLKETSQIITYFFEARLVN
jgi:hypothetical protein